MTPFDTAAALEIAKGIGLHVEDDEAWVCDVTNRNCICFTSRLRKIANLAAARALMEASDFHGFTDWRSHLEALASEYRKST